MAIGEITKLWRVGADTMVEWSFSFDDADGPLVEEPTFGLTLEMPKNDLALLDAIWLRNDQVWAHTGGKRVWAMVGVSGQQRVCDLMMPQEISAGADGDLFGVDTLGGNGLCPAPLHVQGAVLKPINNVSLGQVVYADLAGGVAGVYVAEESLLTDWEVMHIGSADLAGAGKVSFVPMSVKLSTSPAQVANYAALATPGDWEQDTVGMRKPALELTAGVRAASQRCCGLVPAGSFLTVRATHADGTLTPDTSDVAVSMRLHPMRGRGAAFGHGPVMMGYVDGTGGGAERRNLRLYLTVEDGAGGAQLYDPLSDGLEAGGLTVVARYRNMTVIR